MVVEKFRSYLVIYVHKARAKNAVIILNVEQVSYNFLEM